MDENKTDKVVELNTVESEQVVGGAVLLPGGHAGGFGQPLVGGAVAAGDLPGVTKPHIAPPLTRR